MIPTITLSQIEEAARILSKAYAELKVRTSDLHTELATIARRKIGGVKSSAEEVTEAQAKLTALIEAAPELFKKPRTLVLHGIKLGYAKGKGSLEWDDDAQVIRRIRKILPEQAEVLISVKETPSAEALRNLPAADLAKLGVHMVGDTDSATVRILTDDVEKFAQKMIDENLKQAAQAA